MSNQGVGWAVFMVGVMGCSGDEPRSPEDELRAQCEAAYDALCQRACECTPGPKCDLYDGSASFDFNSVDECAALLHSSCEQPIDDDTPDFEACEAAATNAVCHDEPGDESAIFPESCE